MKYIDPAVNFVWFTDKKMFTIDPPFNLQYDWVYVPLGTKKWHINPSCLLRMRSTFSRSVMVSIAVPKWV